jgi:hypothetical protein
MRSASAGFYSQPELARCSLQTVRTLVLDPLPPEVEELIAKRRRLGLDKFDEVWEGVYHMAPMARGRHGYLQGQVGLVLDPLARAGGLLYTGPFNVGKLDDFRVPDGGLHRDLDPEVVWFETAAMVVEVVSAGDETWDKLPFYAAHRVDEVLVVDSDGPRVHLRHLAGDGYKESRDSTLLGVTVEDLAARIDWR